MVNLETTGILEDESERGLMHESNLTVDILLRWLTEPAVCIKGLRISLGSHGSYT